MCPPKAPKVEKIPDRQPSRLPDQGDPAVRMADRNKRRLTSAAMTFTNQRTLGAPSVSGPLSASGGGY